MGVASRDSVRVRGFDLTSQLLGTITFGEMVFLELRGRLPRAEESRVIDAVLVAFVEHGMMATNLAARLTYVGAPEGLQAAVAAGLCGAGDVFLGAIEASAKMLHDGVASGGDPREVAREIVDTYRARKGRIPGLGHPVHSDGDPRTRRLFEIADEVGSAREHVALVRAIEAEAATQFGRLLPINADGACAALVCDLGFSWQIARGFAVIARCVGLVGHLYEEIQSPTARPLWRHIEELYRYKDPT
jgi:citrate synthase